MCVCVYVRLCFFMFCIACNSCYFIFDRVSDAVSPVVVPEAKSKKGSIIEFFGFKKKTNTAPPPVVLTAAKHKKSPVVRTAEQEEELDARRRDWFAHEREALEK